MKVFIFLSSIFSLRLLAAIVEPDNVNQVVLSSPTPVEPEFNSRADTSNFIFASFAGLLEQWSNTFAASGHSIIPGVIPRSTLLYHGTSNGSSPPSDGMEWLAFDPEMSYKIHAGLSGDTHLCTYVSTRPLRIIYLDGQSASLSSAAFLDSQNLLINGKVHEKVKLGLEFLKQDYDRAEELCKLGKTYGFEGVVRMNTGFELIWCDFKKGIELTQVINTTDPFYTKNETKARGHYDVPMYTDSPFYGRAQWNFAQAATRHYKTPGEIRVKLDPTGFISYYDRVESLDLKRKADGTDKKSRSSHRLFGISQKDAQKVLDRLINVLEYKNAKGWNFDSDQLDWQGLVLTIIQTYSQPIKHLEYILKRRDLNPVNQTIEVRALSYGMLMPYIDFSKWNVTDPIWTNQTIEKCRTAFTKGKYYHTDLTESIQTIINAIERTLDRLCSDVYEIFSQTMVLSLPTSSNNTISFNNKTLENQTRSKIPKWRQKTVGLMKWLGWSTWGQCDPECSPEEICLIPFWPGSGEYSLSNLTQEYPVCKNVTYWEKNFAPPDA